MKRLSERAFEKLNNASKALKNNEVLEYLHQLDNWIIAKEGETSQLHKSYKFKNFIEALEFTNRIGAIAEEYNHHPAILTEWGKVEVRWWTHSVGGLHLNDFIMAEKSDGLLR
ncbi:MAG: 4a-hydroxytetrahydrobiopterin dehydratase [Calditrichaeota bacterium]|nr:4a-hydroxytetrahydrobiopterin dehydratase [Calditrichota bacterium]